MRCSSVLLSAPIPGEGYCFEPTTGHELMAIAFQAKASGKRLREALLVALLLINLVSKFTEAKQRLGGRPKPSPRMDLVAEKIKTLSCAPNEVLDGVKA